jgi:retron-type reverse transcriptase
LGVPQGGVLSPLLSNIYLHELDSFMKKLCEKHTDLSIRLSKSNPEYEKLLRQIKVLKDREAGLTIIEKKSLQELKSKLAKTTSVIRKDDTYRVYYNRYADD